MTNGWMNRASDHGKAVPAGAFRFSSSLSHMFFIPNRLHS
jgi:hypothetical protein